MSKRLSLDKLHRIKHDDWNDYRQDAHSSPVDVLDFPMSKQLEPPMTLWGSRDRSARSGYDYGSDGHNKTHRPRLFA